MPLSRRRLTTLSLTLSLLIYAWVGLNLLLQGRPTGVDLTICPLRLVTDIPCATCGTTRALCALSEGQWLESLRLNPLGIVVAIATIVSSLWIAYDALTGQQSYYQSYLKIINSPRRKYIVVSICTLLLINGIWNILKTL